MKKSLLFIALSLITGDLMSKRPEGMVVIGTGWCTDYQAPVLDWLTRRANFVVQTKASLNKPREIIINGVMYRFYHIPVSILQAPHIKVYMAPGTLLDLELLIKEIKTLEKLGIDTKKRIRISASAQILMPYEKRIGANSRKTNNCNMGGGVPVGTGAANADKCMGIAFRVADLMSVDYKNILKISVDRGNNTLVKLYEDAPIDEK